MSFYPEHLAVPELLETPDLLARPLCVSDAALDYAAYMESPAVIRAHSGGRWPTAGFTLAENTALAAMHEREHAERRAFTFTLLAPEGRSCLGCLYIRSLLVLLQRAQAPAELAARAGERTAMVTFWLHQRLQSSEVVDRMVLSIEAWLLSKWELNGHVYRVSLEERRSIVALERAGLEHLAGVVLDGDVPLRFELYA